MTVPVYILIRTSGRPQFFARMMASIQAQSYKKIVTIVHSDDPRDEYVTGDIILHGTAYGLEYGSGTYNLYNNRLLKAIPDEPGYYHFIDDDDEYASPDVIEKLVNQSLEDHVNVGKVSRWDGQIFPKKWGIQKSYQTECFFIHTDYRHKAKWWGNKGGDHHYSKQLTKILPINWIDNLLICKAQQGKGHGWKHDATGKTAHTKQFKPNELVAVMGLVPVKKGHSKDWIRQGTLKMIPYSRAIELEKENKVKITNWSNYIEKPPVRNIYAN
ncbi:MAG: glycosyltransferase family A protein [Desulfobacteraceae bacterium]